MSPGSFDAVTAVLVIPAATAALLAVLPGYRLTSRLNVLAAFLTFLAALSLLPKGHPRLLAAPPHPGDGGLLGPHRGIWSSSLARARLALAHALKPVVDPASRAAGAVASRVVATGAAGCATGWAAGAYPTSSGAGMNCSG